MNQYDVIESTDKSIVYDYVNERCAEGWKPQGGISVCHDPIRNEHKMLYTQALYKPKHTAMGIDTLYDIEENIKRADETLCKGLKKESRVFVIKNQYNLAVEAPTFAEAKDKLEVHLHDMLMSDNKMDEETIKARFAHLRGLKEDDFDSYTLIK